MKKLLIIGTTVMAMTMVHADTLYLTASDNSSSYGNTSFNVWNKNGGGTEAPNSSNDYVVDGGFTMRFPNGSYPSSGGWVWPGKSLRIGTVGGSQGTLVIIRTANSLHTFNNGGLILAKGRVQPWVGDYTQTFTGTITVTAPESAPFDVMLNDTVNHTNQTFAIGGTLKGAAGTALRVYSNTAYPAKFNLTTTPTAFAGTVVVGNGDASKQVTCSTDYNKEMPGGFLITTGSTLTALQNDKHWYIGFLELQSGASFLPPNSGTKWKIGDLTLNGGSTLLTKLANETTSTITLTNSLATSYPVNLTTPTARTSTANTSASTVWSVLTLPTDKGDLGDSVDDFVLATQPSLFPDSLPAVYLRISTNEAQTVASLDLVQRQIVRLTENNSLSRWATTGFDTAVTNAAVWSDGVVPHADADYVVDTKDWALSLPPQDLLGQDKTYEFPGASLTLGAGNVNLYSAATTTRIPVLRMANDARYWPACFQGAGVITVKGDAIHLLATGSGQSYFRIYGGRPYRIEAPLTGAGRLPGFNNSSSSSKPAATILFAADNSAFKGRIKLSGSQGNFTSDYANTILVEDAVQLGGPLDAFAYDALQLNIGSTLAVTNDVDFSTANRGLYVEGSGVVDVADGATLTLGNSVSYGNAATLAKTGAGTLALGASPLNRGAESGVLAIEEGCVKVLSTNALNGVSTAFANGAYLLVDPAATGDVATFGAVDLSATPFGGTLPVAFALPVLGSNETYDYSGVAVCTVADAATAEGLTLGAKRIHGHSVKFSIRTNANGTATVLAAVRASGFIMAIQ